MNKKFYNRTKYSQSISDRLRREKKFHLLLLYQILRQSYLAHEAMDNSGSHLLADHIYRSQSEGNEIWGYLIDRILLSLSSSKAFRKRFIFARDKIYQEIRSRPKTPPLTVLTVPSGIPRECLEVCILIGKTERHNIQFHCLDLSETVLADAKQEVKRYSAEDCFYFHQGDALSAKPYPKKNDIITSTGLGEFLTDGELLAFYRIIHQRLKPNGLFITSGLNRHKLSDFLLRELAEIKTIYRTQDHLLSLLKRSGFSQLQVDPWSCSLQTLVTGRK